MSSPLVSGSDAPGLGRILSTPALVFLGSLHRRFDGPRRELLERRERRQAEVAAGALPDRLPATAELRDAEWTVAPAPPHLQDRRVEFSTPVDARAAATALLSGACIWIADLEDATTPLWENVIGGQLALADLVGGAIDGTGGTAAVAAVPLRSRPALMVRPRGWHLDEKHLTVDEVPLAGALVDFGLFVFHNAAALLAAGSGPALHLPKIESHLEARLWAEVFAFAESELGLPAGSIRASVTIETVWAAFEMDEILWELRDAVVGLNAGPGDYLFSLLKTMRDHARLDEVRVPPAVPAGEDGTTTAATDTVDPFRTAYSDLLVSTCRRRGTVAIAGGVAGTTTGGSQPRPRVPDGFREAQEHQMRSGYAGVVVTDPGLVPLCAEIYTRLPGARGGGAAPPVPADPTALLDLAAVHRAGRPDCTEAALRADIAVALEYLVHWLAGRGSVVIGAVREEAAAAEICRTRIWLRRRDRVVLDTGRKVTPALVAEIADGVLEMLAEVWAEQPGGRNLLADARNLLVDLTTGDRFADFLTREAYELLP
ncbi:malate synthase A [Nakamurella sp. YIM 132087]|uniref:malate synthase n=1 Tax=Nakamurella alba TaxID=2665158 RepID=A0A7K1FN78_9ACTN|nr:malate synthase A [Nakamurella alba]MTD15588.1 malate synthase A [Nakamurella alba]